MKQLLRSMLLVSISFLQLIWLYFKFSDKPTSPNGPLDVSDVHGDHVTLNWRAPDDDGGIPIENYVIEKYDTASGRWVPAAKVAGDKTTAVVDGLIPGHEYKVRIF